MSHILRKPFRGVCIGLLVVITLGLPKIGFSQILDPEDETLPPLVVINAAGAERLLGDVNYMFETIGRKDLTDVVNGFLGNVGDLKGLDRKKSMGVMLYLKPGITPMPEPIGYIPVDNMTDLLKTIELGPVKTKKVPGEDDRYEIQGRRRTFFAELRGGFAYVANDSNALDRELPDAGALTQTLSKRYDLAASVNIEGVPELVRTIFLDFLRAQTEADIQQRDDEPEARYRARKAAGLNNLKNIEAIIKDGKTITLGVDASRETKSIVIELDIEAKAASSFAKQLQRFPGKPTVFANAYSERIPLAATGSWNLSKDDQEVFTEAVKALEVGVTDGLNNQNLDPSGIEGIVKSLVSTIQSGSIDFFFQFVGEPPGKFAFVGGLKVDRSGDFSAGLQTLLQQASKLPDIAELEINAVKHNGVGIHRLLGKGDGDRGEKRLYGGKPALYIGAGRGAVWFSVGKDGADEELKRTMTMVESPGEVEVNRNEIAPFQMVMNLSSWVGLNPDARGRAAEDAREAFDPKNDQLRIVTKPTKNGIRTKIQLDEGFIKFMGLRISQRLDSNQI